MTSFTALMLISGLSITNCVYNPTTELCYKSNDTNVCEKETPVKVIANKADIIKFLPDGYENDLKKPAFIGITKDGDKIIAATFVKPCK